MKKFDVMIIGGGTGGLRTAIAATHKKAKTVLIEPGLLGGTCLNTGCIPTKAMLHAAHLYEQTKNLAEFGVSASNVRVNFPKLMSRVNGIVKQGQDHISLGVNKIPLTIVKEKARFIAPHTVMAGDEKIQAKKIIICTGATNFMPPIKGLDKITPLTNENVLQLKKRPSSLVMLGGGYISMEFATFFAKLGTKVTVLERMSGVLGMLDDDLREVLIDSFEKMGITIITNANIVEIKRKNTSPKGATVIYNDVRNKKSKLHRINATHVFSAMGRKPNTKGLQLDNAHVHLGQRGEITIDDTMRTSNPSIFAIGDVTGRTMFAHAVKRQTGIALSNALFDHQDKMPFDLVPWAVFTDPTASGIGLSEKQLQKSGQDYGILKAEFKRAGRATVNGDTRGFVKILYNKFSRYILGAQIIGPNADDLIHEVAVLMNTKKPKIDTLQQTIHVHPTLAEVMDTLHEAH